MRLRGAGLRLTHARVRPRPADAGTRALDQAAPPALGAPREARGSPPGTMESVAAGDGHLWWVVRRQTPAVPGASRAGETPEYILMHHASEEPAPTERFVLRLGGLPEAMAATRRRTATRLLAVAAADLTRMLEDSARLGPWAA